MPLGAETIFIEISLLFALLKDLAPVDFALYSLTDTSGYFSATASTSLLVEGVKCFEVTAKLGPRELRIQAGEYVHSFPYLFLYARDLKVNPPNCFCSSLVHIPVS